MSAPSQNGNYGNGNNGNGNKNGNGSNRNGNASNNKGDIKGGIELTTSVLASARSPEDDSSTPPAARRLRAVKKWQKAGTKVKIIGSLQRPVRLHKRTALMIEAEKNGTHHYLIAGMMVIMLSMGVLSAFTKAGTFHSESMGL